MLVDKKEATALSHIFQVLYLLGQQFSIKGSLETIFSYIF